MDTTVTLGSDCNDWRERTVVSSDFPLCWELTKGQCLLLLRSQCEGRLRFLGKAPTLCHGAHWFLFLSSSNLLDCGCPVSLKWCVCVFGLRQKDDITSERAQALWGCGKFENTPCILMSISIRWFWSQTFLLPSADQLPFSFRHEVSGCFKYPPNCRACTNINSRTPSDPVLISSLSGHSWKDHIRPSQPETERWE